MDLFLDPKWTFVHDEKEYKGDDSRSLLLSTRRGALKLREPDRIYRIDINGGEGPRRTWLEGLTIVRTKLKQMDVGESVKMLAFDKVQPEKRLDQVRFFKTAHKVPVADSSGVEGIDRWEGYLRDQWSSRTFRFAGDCVCKSVVGGGHSDHADCAACDDFDTIANMRAQKDFALSHAVYFHTKYAILERTIYTVNSDGVHWSTGSYGGEYHSHLHFSCNGGIFNSAC